MRISVILAHPNPESFNHAIAQTAVDAIKANGHRIFFHDLYQEKFDPRLNIEELANDAILPPVIRKHCEEIAAVDGIVIVHPNWWGQPPAILKGWVDRVIRPGVAYEFTGGRFRRRHTQRLAQSRAVLVFNTSNTKSEREEEVFGDPLETIWKNCIFGLCGVNNFHRRMFNVIVTSTDDQRRDWLGDVEKDINHFFPKDAA